MNIMKLLATIILVVFVSLVSSEKWFKLQKSMHYEPPFEALSDDMVAYINSLPGNTWKAAKTDRFKTIADVKRQLGVLKDPNNTTLPEKQVNLNGVTLPSSFDARQRWPYCKSISEIRDQSDCGSCWAFGAVEAMSDRICIASGGNLQTRLSAEDLLTCCGLYCGFGCHGGLPPQAWKYWVHWGIVTGGKHGSHQGCRDYAFPKCDYDVAKLNSNCDVKVHTPPCLRTCQAGYPKMYKDDKRKGKSYYKVKSSQESIMHEIMTHGPVEATFMVFKDFSVYKSGVYKHVSNVIVGLHAVKILGWGKENGTPYWLVANSWNTTWGDKGYFKILRGHNECGIELLVMGGLPQL